ncbi:MAG: permease [Proteobacteria bacterium]|nr:permease [Pseudomonadota bacterium]
MTLTIPIFALIMFCVVTEAAREVCFRHAAQDTGFVDALKKPMTWLGIAFWAVELVAWVVVLEHVALSVAFPLMALVYVVIVGAGAWIFKEPVNVRHGIGAVLITAGVACVGATGI